MRYMFVFVALMIAANAQMVNAIAAVVMGEPITTYDVESYAQAQKIGKKEAFERLIDDRLKQAKVKELGLTVGEDEIDSRIEQIAKRNNIESKTLREMIVARGMEWSSYRSNAKEAILNEKLSSAVMSSEFIPVSEEEMDRYYKANRSKFTQPSEIVVIQYASRNEKSLREAVRNPMISDPNIATTTQVLQAKELNANLYAVLTQTPIGGFTPIFPAGDRLVALLVREKRGAIPVSFESAKNEIAQILRTQFEERSIENYFAKTRAKADITILRPVL
ncbi:hypothetical protein AGMMS50229_02950 [Campylobacterota bacterium]|nr:hypothetical protein AGMMS50229_02950 [Campylobacterota bacterium]